MNAILRLFDERPGAGRVAVGELSVSASERLTARALILRTAVDPEAGEAALKAFDRGFFLLVDDRQVETLDEELLLHPEVEVTFLRLPQLVGG